MRGLKAIATHKYANLTIKTTVKTSKDNVNNTSPALYKINWKICLNALSWQETPATLLLLYCK